MKWIEETYALSERIEDAAEEHHGKAALLLGRGAVAAPASAPVVPTASLVVVGQHLNTGTQL